MMNAPSHSSTVDVAAPVVFAATPVVFEKVVGVGVAVFVSVQPASVYVPITAQVGMYDADVEDRVGDG